MRLTIAAIRAVHPFPSTLVSIVTVGLVWFADNAAPTQRYLTLGIGMLLFQCAIGLTNDVVDARQDAAAKPWKPVGSGAIPRSAAAIAAVACATVGLGVTATLSHVAWFVGLSGLGAGLAYDLYLKRTPLSWLPYAIGLPLVPVWVYVSSDAWRPLLGFALPLGALLGFALNLANEAPDASAGDKAGLAGRVGARNARRLTLATFGCAVLAAAVVLSTTSPNAALASLALGGAGLVAARGSTAFGRDGLFGVLAVVSAALALLFLTNV